MAMRYAMNYALKAALGRYLAASLPPTGQVGRK
ncbi:hypothetical protein ABH905_004265 [Pseudomonas frederiksbergensis]|jgi:hypothetical protein